MSVRHYRISRFHIAQGILAVFRSDVNFQILCTHPLFLKKSPICLHNARYLPLLCLYDHLLSRISRNDNASSVHYLKSAILSNIGDHQSDLVRMGRKQNPHRAVRVGDADQIVHLVLPDLIRNVLHLLPDNVLQRLFISGHGNTL